MLLGKYSNELKLNHYLLKESETLNTYISRYNKVDNVKNYVTRATLRVLDPFNDFSKCPAITYLHKIAKFYNVS